MSKNFLLEYIWLDGYETTNLRSKVKVLSLDTTVPTVADCPESYFDGFSTKQAPGGKSECLLQPVRLYKWAENHYFVLCEVLDADGNTHISNKRALLREHAEVFQKAKSGGDLSKNILLPKIFNHSVFQREDILDLKDSTTVVSEEIKFEVVSW